MRAFTKLRQMLSTHEDLKRKIEAMEKKHDRQFQIVFEAIKQLLETGAKPSGTDLTDHYVDTLRALGKEKEHARGH